MKKIFSLLRAAMSQDMSMFRVKTKGKTKAKKIILPILLAGLVMFSIGSNVALIAEELSKVGLTFIVLTLFIMLTAILTIMEGIYKSQGMLFEAKDSDLLFSLPITKTQIFFTRVVKLLSFQIIYNAVFMLPAIIVYAMYEKTNATFYITSALSLLLLPIIPTIVGCILGYAVKAVASKFKSKRFVQLISTLLIFVVIFYISFNMQAFLENIVQNATSINDLITKIYYPAGLYIKLIQSFNVIDLLKFIGITAIPAVVFIYLAGIFYFKIVSKLTEKGSKVKKIEIKNLKQKDKIKRPMWALIGKEIKRFFTSPIFLLNAGMGLALMVVFTIALSINARGIINDLVTQEGFGIDLDIAMSYIPKIFLAVVVFTSFMTSITSSMISLEGKTFNILKSLPVRAEKILLAKVLTSNLISIPVILICDIAFFVIFKVGLIESIFILVATFIIPTFTALFGILANLKYPKMNWVSDAEVVKQSMSSFVSVFTGMFLGIGTIALAVWGAKYNINLVIGLELAVFGIACLILWKILKIYGVKKFNEINV